MNGDTHSARTSDGVESGALSAVVASFAAIIHMPEGDAPAGRSPEGEIWLGAVAGDDALPKPARRRLSVFDLGVARCLTGLHRHGDEETIVFASRHGNMDVVTTLFDQLAQRELMSPAKFSMSVHNAALGAASQITGNRAGHTAVAAGRRSLCAGLTEAWMRLRAGEPGVTVCYADLPLPGVYAESDEPGPGVHLAMRLLPGTDEVGHRVETGRAGAERVARRLGSGAGCVSWLR